MAQLSDNQTIEALERGDVVALPTESSFALAARIDRPKALDALLALKDGRRDPIGLMIGDAAQLDAYVRTVPRAARVLAQTYWPGALTLVLDAGESVPDAVTAGGGTVGLRVPGLAPLTALLRRIGVAVTATSGNPPGRPPATTLDALAAYFPGLDTWAAFAETPGGAPSTVVDGRGATPVVLRQGAVILPTAADAGA